MERTKYFNNTKPTDVQLNWTETSRTHAITERMRAVTQFGIVEGFQVTINGTDPTKVDIAGGAAYAGGKYIINDYDGEGAGERISTETFSPSGTIEYGTAASEVNLADYTNGVDNYVSLIYGETESYPLAERAYPFTNRDTVVTETYSVSVLAQTDWEALSAANKNKRILVAVITANGSGTALTSASIAQFSQPKTHPTPSQPVSITGVTILSVSDTTHVGTGTLRFESSTSKLYWAAPGDTEGIGVSIPSSGDYVLYSDSTSYSITVEVIYANLPAAETSESINIQSLYGRIFPIFSAKDTAHRDMIGSGSPTSSNPHGLSLADISEGTFDHADLFHVNGISADADDNQLECSIDAINERILVNNVGSFRNSFLVDGITYESLTGVSAGSSGTSEFNILPLPTSGEYLIYIDSAGEVQRVQVGTALWDTNIVIVDMENTTAGNGTITWDSAANSLEYEAPGDGAAGAMVFVVPDTPAATGASGYYKLYSSNTDNWVIVYCDGVLGANNSTTFAIAKNSVDNSDELILKLAVVEWDSGAASLTNLRDIRKFSTADNRTALLEEHDENGLHNVPLQQRFRVTEANYAIAGSARTVVGVHGGAPNVGVFGSAATNIGVEGYAAVDTAVYGLALNDMAVVGSAGADQGVRGIAEVNSGVYGSAKAAYGGYFVGSTVGVYGFATNVGIRGSAEVATAIAGLAPTDAIIGSANAGTCGVKGIAGAVLNHQDYGVIGLAYANTGVYGTAATNYGVYGKAVGSYGVYGTAVDKYGVYGKAQTYGLYGNAAISYGVYGAAVERYGVFGTASNMGGAFAAVGSTPGSIYGAYATAANVDTVSEAVGVCGEAGGAGATGVYGINGGAGINGVGVKGYVVGATGTGVYGINLGAVADGIGVKGVAAGSSGTGAYGSAHGATGTGVYGYAAGSLGVGVFGGATAASCYGVYGSAPTGVLGGTGVLGRGEIGVYGAGSDTGVYCSGLFGYNPPSTTNAVVGNMALPISVSGHGTCWFNVLSV